MQGLVFREKQKFTQWWLWLILIPIGILPFVGIYQQLILKKPMGDQPMSDLGLIIFSILVFSLIGLFFILQLKTEINQTEIRMTFVPFVKRNYKWRDVKKAEVIKYGFVGGWGIRLWTKYGTVYNTKGNKGLAIEFTDGKKILIGSLREAELAKAIEQIKKQYRIQ